MSENYQTALLKYLKWELSEADRIAKTVPGLDYEASVYWSNRAVNIRAAIAALESPKDVSVPEPPGSDPVSHPSHYTSGREGFEVIQEIRNHTTPEQMFGYCLGNAMKYICRAGHKDDTVKDLSKAIWYLNYLVAELKGEHDRTKEDSDVQA